MCGAFFPISESFFYPAAQGLLKHKSCKTSHTFVWLVYFKSPLHHTAAKLTSPVILEPVLEDK